MTAISRIARFMENLDPTLPPEMVRRGFILDSVQNCSCVRAMLFGIQYPSGLKLRPRLTAAWLAQLGERRSAKWGGGGGEGGGTETEYCEGGW